ncbi:13506_t:CDS:1, partial [Funneliformis geosporum]
RKRGLKAKVTINTRIDEYPGKFRVDDRLLFCNFCDHSVDWVQKSTIDNHLNSISHKNKKYLYENKQRRQQQTLVTSFSSSESKKIIIHDLIEAFTAADIPLEK